MDRKVEPTQDGSISGGVAWVDRVDAVLDRWYAYTGVWLGSLLLALVLLAVAYLIINGSTDQVIHGAEFAALSEHPFDFDHPNRFRTRILVPLIGWIIQLKGEWFFLVPWSFLPAFLAVVNVWCRRTGTGSTLAAMVMMSLVFSPVVLHFLVAPGIPESAAYFMIGAALLMVRKSLLSCACMALAVMTHEAAAFLIPPWLLAAGWSNAWSRVGLGRVVGLGLMLLPYLVYRWWIAQHDGAALTTAFYLNQRNVEACLSVGPLATIRGAFAVYRLHWLLLVVLFLIPGQRSPLMRWSALVVISVGLTLLVAYDTTRMLCWTFPILAVGAVELNERLGRERAVLLFLAAWVLNFLVPAYTTSGRGLYRLDRIRTYIGPGDGFTSTLSPPGPSRSDATSVHQPC